MPTSWSHRRETERRQDVMKVTIEDVNLNAIPYPLAQGRDRRQSWALFDIDLTHGVGGRFPTPAVGEVWWIKRSIGSRWILDHKVDALRTGSGEEGTTNRSDVPTNVTLAFNVREKKTHVEYEAFVTFDGVTTDVDGNAVVVDHYVIDWVPTTKAGNIVTDEKVRQHLWSPNDPTIDAPEDPAADFYAILPGNVPRPKVWYWKARIRAVDGGKSEWSEWTDPVLPIRASLPSPPIPGNVSLEFRWKDSQHDPIFSAITQFDDVNYWDIPGYDYEDDITEYEVQLEPITRNDSSGAIDLTGATTAIEEHDNHKYDRADPNGDGKPWPVRRQKVKDKDADDTFVTLGLLAEDITTVDTIFDVDETGVVGTPVVPFIVETNTGEEWLVTSRTLISASTYTYEVYRQFNDSAAQSHLAAEALTWLKDPYVYHVDFNNVERPKTVYWRTRVRSKDRFNRIGDWSAWTAPALPWRSIDWTVPAPSDLRADIELHEHKTHPEFKLVARFKDPAPNGWDLPGGDPQDDLAHYVVVAEALIPDPDGYIDGGAQPWDSGLTYTRYDKVVRGGLIYESVASNNLNHQPPNSAFWVVSGTGMQFIIPDTKIGIVKTAVTPAATTMTITLDSGLVKSVRDIINNADKQTFYMRIQSGSEVNETRNEVVAVEAITASGNDRTLTVVRAQKESADFPHAAGDAVYMLTEHRRRQIVQDKDEKSPGHRAERYTVTLGQIPQPRRLYWRVRAQSVDTHGHKSVWTPWTSPVNPSSDPDLVINAPSYVALSFDRVHRDRWVRHRALVEWNEVDYTAPDGDREPDVTRYGVQLANTDGDEIDVGISSADLTMSVLEVRQTPAPVEFFVLIDDEIIKVTARTLVVDRQYNYTIQRGQNDTVAAAHVQGSRIYQYPFSHQTVSAKKDGDSNSFNKIAFPRAQKFRHYKARVKAYDRYNRTSLWSAWSAEGTPSDHVPPPVPTALSADIDNHKVVINWDYPVDNADPNEPFPDTSDEAAYFQVQLSTRSDYKPLLKFDRYVASTHKTFRLKKPGNGTFYIRVRAADGSGNKSAWVETFGAQNGVPTPNAPTITYDVIEETKKIRAEVLLATGVTHLDDDINGYEFELQPAEYKRSTETIGVAETAIDTTNTSDLPNTSFTAFIQDEQITVTNVSGGGIWTVTRGVAGTTAVNHRNRARLQYFRANTQARRRRTGEETSVDDPILCVFGNIERGLWYRARVRAKNTKGLWGDWSSWS